MDAWRRRSIRVRAVLSSLGFAHRAALLTANTSARTSCGVAIDSLRACTQVELRSATRLRSESEASLFFLTSLCTKRIKTCRSRLLGYTRYSARLDTAQRDLHKREPASVHVRPPAQCKGYRLGLILLRISFKAPAMSLGFYLVCFVCEGRTSSGEKRSVVEECRSH